MYEDFDFSVPFWICCWVCLSSMHQENTETLILIFFKGRLRSFHRGQSEPLNEQPRNAFSFEEDLCSHGRYQCSSLAGNAKNELTSQ